MIFLKFVNIWSFFFFFYILYVFIIFFIIFYLISNFQYLTNFFNFKKNFNFQYIIGMDLYLITTTIIMLIFLINYTWSSPVLITWFGNIIITNFQYKISYLIIFIFYLVISVYLTSFYFSNKEMFDFIIIIFNFFFWMYFFFYANTLFTIIFFIEIISTLIFLLITISTFSNTFFYNNLNLNLNYYFQSSTPFFYIQMLIFFFWISLLASLNLFFFLILFYIKFLTFDWFIFEYIFNYFIKINNIQEVLTTTAIWFNLLFAIFLKSGLVPFFFWKPIFFKGMTFHLLFFYIFFFYFFLILFFLNFFLNYMNDLFYYFIYINILILFTGIFFLFFFLCESYYIKSFLALSSILNTLFVFLALNGTHIIDFNFIF